MNWIRKPSLLLTAAAISWFSSTAQAASANLNIINGDFETDAVGTNGATGWIIEPNHYWTTDGTGISGPLDPVGGAEGSAKYLSANYLAGAGGPNLTNAFAIQDIDISAYATDIDSGGVTLDFDYWYVNGDTSKETTFISIEFFDASFSPIGLATSGTLAETASGPTWTQGTIDGGAIAVPTLTRFFAIGISHQRFESAEETNAAIDQVSATLNGVVPEPSSLAVLGLGAFMLLRRRRV